MAEPGKVHELLDVLTALADPLRLVIVGHLAGGPAAVSELVAVTGATQSNVSNHLALLRKRRLVRAVTRGRQRVYELQDARVAQLVESLNTVGGAKTAPVIKDAALINARTCYDHLAGKLGVRLFTALAERKAILLTGTGTAGAAGKAAGDVTLGPAAEHVFGTLGIALDEAIPKRRKPGYACLDWTERRPHLGGSLGRALWSRFVEQGWVTRKPGTRAVLVTPSGKRGLSRHLSISLS